MRAAPASVWRAGDGVTDGETVRTAPTRPAGAASTVKDPRTSGNALASKIPRLCEKLFHLSLFLLLNGPTIRFRGTIQVSKTSSDDLAKYDH